MELVGEGGAFQQLEHSYCWRRCCCCAWVTAWDDEKVWPAAAVASIVDSQLSLSLIWRSSRNWRRRLRSPTQLAQQLRPCAIGIGWCRTTRVPAVVTQNRSAVTVTWISNTPSCRERQRQRNEGSSLTGRSYEYCCCAPLRLILLATIDGITAVAVDVAPTNHSAAMDHGVPFLSCLTAAAAWGNKNSETRRSDGVDDNDDNQWACRPCRQVAVAAVQECRSF